ncbi:hypothetical protein IJ541_07220 [bacterium]|nr:hypothetical protein [bacterium]
MPRLSRRKFARFFLTKNVNYRKKKGKKMILQDFTRTKIYIDKIKTKIPNSYCSYPDDLPYFTNKIGVQIWRHSDGLGLQFSGKLFVMPNSLGAITIENADQIAEVIEQKTNVKIDSDYLLKEAPIYEVHLKTDIYTEEEKLEDYLSDIREVAKAETDKYDVYRYDDVVYEKGLQVLSKPSSLAVVPKAKKNERFAIYIKGAEIRASEDREYRQQLDHGFLVQTDRILRFELQLRSFDDMRKFCGIRKYDIPCLMDILKSDRNPVYNKFCELVDNEMKVKDED